MSLTELQEKRGRLVTQAREALNEITKNTDESRAAELEARHDAIMAEFDAVEKNIAREERVAAAERSMEERRAKQRPTQADAEVRGVDEGAKAEYRMAFAKVLCGMQDDLTAEERALLRTHAAEFRAQTAGTTTAGGYTVPTELANQIIKSMAAWGPMYDDAVATVISTPGGGTIYLPTVNDTATAVVAHTEATALTDDGGSDAVFGRKQLDAFAFDTEFVRWSWELNQDSIFSMESLLGDLLGERLGRRANTELTTGSGSSAPNGFLTASTVGKTAASTTAFTADEIIDLVHSVDPAYRGSPKAGFQFHDAVFAAIRKLKDGQGNYLWQMGDVRSGAPGTLLNYGYRINQAMPSAFTTGQKLIAFGDFGKYFVRKVGSPVIGVLRERFWPDMGIAGLIRFDGELGDTAALKHLKLA